MSWLRKLLRLKPPPEHVIDSRIEWPVIVRHDWEQSEDDFESPQCLLMNIEFWNAPDYAEEDDDAITLRDAKGRELEGFIDISSHVELRLKEPSSQE